MFVVQRGITRNLTQVFINIYCFSLMGEWYFFVVVLIFVFIFIFMIMLIFVVLPIFMVIIVFIIFVVNFYYVQGRITRNNMQLLIDAFSSCRCDHSYLHGCACCVVRKSNIKSWLCFFSTEEEEQ